VSNIDRRQFLAGGLKGAAALGVAGMGGVLLDACGGGSSGTSGPATTVGRKAATFVGVDKAGVKPKFGGTIAFGNDAEQIGLDPSFGHWDGSGIMYARCVYDPLAMIDYHGNVVPYLAESIVPAKDYSSWTITVRPNVFFHDGTPCDADALAYCMRLYLGPNALSSFAYRSYVDTSNPQKAVQKIGPRSIRINMQLPWVPFDYWLAGYIGGAVAYMFSPTQYEKGESVLNTHPIGTGPFKFESWNVGQKLSFVRNPHYWRKDQWGRQLPYLDGFDFLPQPDEDTRFHSLQSGVVQMMHTNDAAIILQLRGDTSVGALGDDELLVGEPDVDFIVINTTDPVMKDPLIRKALAYATDQKSISEVIGRGITRPANGPFPHPSPYASNTGYPGFNLRKASAYYKQFLAKHGGSQPPITLTTTDSPQALGAASFLQSMWKKAGINISVTQVQQAKMIGDMITGTSQMFAYRMFGNVDPDLNYIFWAADSGPINFAHNYDKVIQKALDTGRQSSNPTLRKEAYQTVAAQFAVDLPFIFLGRKVWYVAADKSVQNWNNPTTPAGKRGVSALTGIIWPTEIWLQH
jgi:peptide/nickel transport system substrate-binding protein